MATSAHQDTHDAPNICLDFTTLLSQTVKKARVLRDIVASDSDSSPELLTEVRTFAFALETEHEFIQSGEAGPGADCDIGFMNRAIRGIAAKSAGLSSFCGSVIESNVGSHPRVVLMVKKTADSLAKEWAALPTSDLPWENPITTFVEFRSLTDIIRGFQIESRETRSALLSLTRASSTMPHLSPIVRPAIRKLLEMSNEVGVVEAGLIGLEENIRAGEFDFEFMQMVSKAVSQHALLMGADFLPLIELSKKLPPRQQALLAPLVKRRANWVPIGLAGHQLSSIIDLHYIEQDSSVPMAPSPKSKATKVRNRDLKRRSGIITSATSTSTTTAPSSGEGEIEQVDGAGGIDGCADGEGDTVDRTDTLLMGESASAADSRPFYITNDNTESRIPRKDRCQSTPKPTI